MHMEQFIHDIDLTSSIVGWTGKYKGQELRVSGLKIRYPRVGGHGRWTKGPPKQTLGAAVLWCKSKINEWAREEAARKVNARPNGRDMEDLCKLSACVGTRVDSLHTAYSLGVARDSREARETGIICQPHTSLTRLANEAQKLSDLAREMSKIPWTE